MMEIIVKEDLSVKNLLDFGELLFTEYTDDDLDIYGICTNYQILVDGQDIKRILDTKDSCSVCVNFNNGSFKVVDSIYSLLGDVVEVYYISKKRLDINI